MEYKLIDSGKTIGDSFAMGCKIYKTKYDDLFLSEIDTSTGKDLRFERLLCSVHKNGQKIGCISKTFLEDKSEMDALVEEYYEKCHTRIKHTKKVRKDRLNHNLYAWATYSAAIILLFYIGNYFNTTMVAIAIVIGFGFGLLNDILTQLRKLNGEKL